MTTEFTRHLDRATCLAILAEAPDHVLRGGVAALLASPIALVKPSAPVKPASKPAAPVKPAAAASGNVYHAAAVAELAPEGFSAGMLAELLQIESRSSAIKTAIQNAIKAKTLFVAGEKRFTRYGATAAIAKAAVAAAKSQKKSQKAAA
jgi:hypothetical protein